MYYQYEINQLINIHMIGHSICQKGWGIYERKLPDLELIVVYKGSFIYECEGRKYTVDEGQACLLPPGAATSIYTSEGGSCRFYYVHFDNIAGFLQLTREELDNSLQQYQRQFQDMQINIHMVPAVDTNLLYISEKVELSKNKEKIFALFESALYERNYSNQNNILMISFYISQILIIISREVIEQASTILNQNTINKTVQEALFFIRQNYNKDINIQKLSKSLGITQQYFMRLFKQATGVSPVKYINKLRIQTAKNMLRNLSLNISEIGYSVGFNNIFYFSRIFKQYEGITPTEYRGWLDSKSNE